LNFARLVFGAPARLPAAGAYKICAEKMQKSKFLCCNFFCLAPYRQHIKRRGFAGCSRGFVQSERV